MKHTFIVFFLLASLCLFSCSQKAAFREYNVLVIHSYEADFTAYEEFNSRLAQAFRYRSVEPNLRFIYTDCERYNSQDEVTHLSAMLDSLGTWLPSVVLVNDDQALYSFLMTDHQLAQQLPVIFAGVNFPNEELLNRYPNVTGFRDKIAIIENSRVVRELTGDTLSFLFHDFTFLDNKVRQLYKDEQLIELNEYERQHELPLTSAHRPDLDSVLQRAVLQEILPQIDVISLRSQGAELFSSFMWKIGAYGQSSHYIQTKRDFTVYGVSNIMYGASFTAINEAFGYDEMLLGGYFTSMATQVNDQVGAAIRILRGEAPSDIPITDSSKGYYVDWNVVQKLGMKLRDLPPKYTIINITVSDRYPNLIIIVVALLTILLVGAMYMYVRLNQNENKSHIRNLYQNNRLP